MGGSCQDSRLLWKRDRQADGERAGRGVREQGLRAHSRPVPRGCGLQGRRAPAKEKISSW
uniref:Uncharacterized protein n=1 Tax=Arundo donax TaxID=35708 RepID=A0A0A9AVM9_ARUDO